MERDKMKESKKRIKKINYREKIDRKRAREIKRRLRYFNTLLQRLHLNKQ